MLTGDYSVAVFGQLVDRLETAPAVVTLITVMSTTTTQGLSDISFVESSHLPLLAVTSYTK